MAAPFSNSCTLNGNRGDNSVADPWEDLVQKGIFLTNCASQNPDQDLSSKDVEYVLSAELARHIAGLNWKEELDPTDDTDDAWRYPYAQTKFRSSYMKEHPGEDITEKDAAHTLSLEVSHHIAGAQGLDDDKMKLLLNKETNFRLVDKFVNRSLERKLDREIIEARNGSELSTEARQRARAQFEYIKTNFETSDRFYLQARMYYTRLGVN